ncbi:MAG: hypothetical protein ACKOC8_03720 [Pirellulales bacterium]
MITALLLGVFVAVAFALWREGLWGAMIMTLNALLAASFATAWYERLVALARERMPSYDYLLDFICLWGLFALVLLVLREVTDRASRTKVRFRRPVELFGGPVVAAIGAWVMVCFTAASLHTAAVPRDVVQPTPEARMFFGFAPDRRWLHWVRGSSVHGPFAGRKENAFDPQADFIVRYATRRKQLEAGAELRVNP